MVAKRVKVLMFAEAVTLAHVARPLSLAKALDPERYDVVIACDPRYAKFVADGPWRHVELSSIPSAQFMRALARGTPVYDLSTLQSYMGQDLALIEAIEPDLVVGDFRLSLSVSCRLAQRPYATITNAYWSPSYQGGFALPVLPVTRLLPLSWARLLFDMLRPVVFKGHCRPLNQLRQQNGMPSLGSDLRRVYTDADHMLIADSPALFPLAPSPANQSFIGPLMWSPTVPLPDWWNLDDPERARKAYVTLGSSGPPGLLSTVLRALDGLPLQVMASSAGAPMPRDVPANAHVASYLPGDAATERASLVVCNGGSLTVQQALSMGVPVLGLASNMDQFLNMAVVEAAGAGKVLRVDRLSAASIRAASQALLLDPAHAAAAQRLRSVLQQGPGVGEVFDRVAEKLLTRA